MKHIFYLIIDFHLFASKVPHQAFKVHIVLPVLSRPACRFFISSCWSSASPQFSKARHSWKLHLIIRVYLHSPQKQSVAGKPTLVKLGGSCTLILWTQKRQLRSCKVVISPKSRFRQVIWESSPPPHFFHWQNWWLNLKAVCSRQLDSSISFKILQSWIKKKKKNAF